MMSRKANTYSYKNFKPLKFYLLEVDMPNFHQKLN
jgi:hypothetical protein